MEDKAIRLTKYIFLVIIFLNSFLHSQEDFIVDDFNKKTTLWEPYVEFSITASTEGNPFDEIAAVTFTNTTSASVIRTEMFYNLNNEWKFRFTGTELGIWTYISSSANPNLDSIKGSVLVEPNNNLRSKGFVTSSNSLWATTDNINDVYVPQFVMYASPRYFYQNESQIDEDISTFLIDHGFSGFQIPGSNYWFDIELTSSSDIINVHGNNPNPDIKVFEALELLIIKLHKINKKVHIWLWGDESDNRTPTALKGGINGEPDKRLMRYIAARLGPLPGWTMEYGFDNWEWVTTSQVDDWRQYIREHIDPQYSHLLGVRGGGNSDRDNNGATHPSYDEQLNQISEQMDYSSYEQHKPSYKMYLETIKKRPNKPSFSEDRFRIRDKQYDKDYNMTEVRRGLYHSTLAGGVANIWGVLLTESPEPDRDRAEFKSDVFPNPEWIKTYSQFFENRFLSDFIVDSSFSNGYGLITNDNSHLIAYKENTELFRFDLRNVLNPLPVIGVDTKDSYKEIQLGLLTQNLYTWHTPYKSDWIIAIGYFDSLNNSYSRDSIVNLDSLLSSNQFQITSFSAIENSGNADIILVTNSEKNITSIELQKTESNVISWSALSNFSPNNQQNELTIYSYSDISFNPDNYPLYRIKTTFNDGSFNISDSITVSVRDTLSTANIEIYSFASTITSQEVTISIITTYEEDINKIELQRSEEQNIFWNTLTRFVPNNKLNQINVYAFTDTTAMTGINYLYRVKTTLNSGSIIISDSIKVISVDSVYNNQIEIQSFSAEQNFSNIEVSLITVFEENVDKIEFQRSEFLKLSWEKVADFESANSQTVKNIYSFTDKIPFPEKKYVYRTQIIYKDGSSEFTESINISGSPNDYLLLQNYPNPFNNSTIIEFSLPQNTIVNLSIYNSLGELIDVIYNQILNAGYHKIEFNVNNLPSGMYIYTLKAGYYFNRKKMLLLK